jgi:hypothetical protein
MVNKHVNCLQCSLSTEKVYDKHELTNQDLEACISLSEHMAEAYNHVNDKEHAMPKELRELLKKINRPKLIF